MWASIKAHILPSLQSGRALIHSALPNVAQLEVYQTRILTFSGLGSRDSFLLALLALVRSQEVARKVGFGGRQRRD